MVGAVIESQMNHLSDDLLYGNKFEDTVGHGGPWKSMRVEIRPVWRHLVCGSTVISRAQVTGTFATYDRFLDGFSAAPILSTG
jgi:hypothetical protein